MAGGVNTGRYQPRRRELTPEEPSKPAPSNFRQGFLRQHLQRCLLDYWRGHTRRSNLLKEHGVPKDNAQHKIVYVHGIDNCRHDAVVAETMSPETVKDLGIYAVTFDRPGYGQSDPNPKRTVKLHRNAVAS